MALQTGVLEDDKRGHASDVALEMPGGLFQQSSPQNRLHVLSESATFSSIIRILGSVCVH